MSGKYYCVCHVQNNYTVFRFTKTDQDGTCINCGYSAVYMQDNRDKRNVVTHTDNSTKYKSIDYYDESDCYGFTLDNFSSVETSYDEKGSN